MIYETTNTKQKIKIKKSIDDKKLNIKEKNEINSLSYINSQTAKNGYKEEKLICEDLKRKSVKQAFAPMLGNNYNEFNRMEGNYKSDIQSDNKILKAQVKKYQKGRFQQIDRHWTSDLIKNIPELEEVSEILKDLFEFPLLQNGTHIDKSKNRIKLCCSNYSQEILDNFLDLLNRNKKEILEYGFYGNNLETKPDYLFGVKYENKKRQIIKLMRYDDIIKHLTKLNFKISPRKTCILLGDNSTVSLQRKGGDSGKKSSNQLQIKFILSNLIDKVPTLEYKL